MLGPAGPAGSGPGPTGSGPGPTGSGPGTAGGSRPGAGSGTDPYQLEHEQHQPLAPEPGSPTSPSGHSPRRSTKVQLPRGRRIVIAVDHDGCADRQVHYACKVGCSCQLLLKSPDDRVELVHVQQKGHPQGGGSGSGGTAGMLSQQGSAGGLSLAGSGLGQGQGLGLGLGVSHGGSTLAAGFGGSAPLLPAIPEQREQGAASVGQGQGWGWGQGGNLPAGAGPGGTGTTPGQQYPLGSGQQRPSPFSSTSSGGLQSGGGSGGMPVTGASPGAVAATPALPDPVPIPIPAASLAAAAAAAGDADSPGAGVSGSGRGLALLSQPHSPRLGSPAGGGSLDMGQWRSAGSGSFLLAAPGSQQQLLQQEGCGELLERCRLLLLAESRRVRPDNVSVRLLPATSRADKAIAKLCSQEGCDILLMGSRGHKSKLLSMIGYGGSSSHYCKEHLPATRVVVVRPPQ